MHVEDAIATAVGLGGLTFLFVRAPREDRVEALWAGTQFMGVGLAGLVVLGIRGYARLSAAQRMQATNEWTDGLVIAAGVLAFSFVLGATISLLKGWNRRRQAST